MSQKFTSQRLSLPLTLLFGFLLIGSVVAAESDPWLRPDVAPAPPENQLTPARVLSASCCSSIRACRARAR